MPALITELIDKTDNSELVRDQIAAIIAVEAAAQEALATAAGKDPRLWRLRTFLERSNPWSEFQEDVADQADATPIVNVSFESASADMSASNVVERQKMAGSFNVDCYGYGLSAAEDDGGHVAGDEAAALEAQRAVRLVRNILMAGHYTYLGMRGVVWKRWPQSVTAFQPAIDGRTVQQIVACRLVLQVEYSEFSPQVQGEELELISATVKRAETGEIYITADYEFGDS